MNQDLTFDTLKSPLISVSGLFSCELEFVWFAKLGRIFGVSLA